VIKGLRIGAFIGHLAREKLKTIEELYNEFEKYYKSDSDLRKRLEEERQYKQTQGNNRNTSRDRRGQNQSQQGFDQQVLNMTTRETTSKLSSHQGLTKMLGHRASTTTGETIVP
jgi:hypothetical protein